MISKEQAEVIATELVAKAIEKRREASWIWEFVPSFVPWYYQSPRLRKLRPGLRHTLLREAKATAGARASTTLCVVLLIALALGVALSIWSRFVNANREYLLIIPAAIAIAWVACVRFELSKLLRRQGVSGGSSGVA